MRVFNQLGSSFATRYDMYKLIVVRIAPRPNTLSSWGKEKNVYKCFYKIASHADTSTHSPFWNQAQIGSSVTVNHFEMRLSNYKGIWFQNMLSVHFGLRLLQFTYQMNTSVVTHYFNWCIRLLECNLCSSCIYIYIAL